MAAPRSAASLGPRWGLPGDGEEERVGRGRVGMEAGRVTQTGARSIHRLRWTPSWRAGVSGCLSFCTRLGLQEPEWDMEGGLC